MLKIGRYLNGGFRFTVKIQVSQTEQVYLAEVTGNQTFAIFEEKTMRKIAKCKTYYPKFLDALLFSKKTKIEVSAIQNEGCILNGHYDNGFYVFEKDGAAFFISRSPFKRKILDFKGAEVPVKRESFFSWTYCFQIETASFEDIVLCTYAYLLWDAS
ncbi:MAG: hypothetical protein LBD14_03030 [Puniceicoccales bacterium]|jgi:hypothetical protein|nr:hypothetical protein [Puniceicoccales bacterium]